MRRKIVINNKCYQMPFFRRQRIYKPLYGFEKNIQQNFPAISNFNEYKIYLFSKKIDGIKRPVLVIQTKDMKICPGFLLKDDELLFLQRIRK